jgi:two-component system cell cycle response regulator
MSAKVLVVDDIDVNVRLLEAKLLSEYYDVLTASDGPKALDIAQAEMPDIVLLDVMMPGMDGLEVCRRLKSNPKTRFLPVVMVTALSDVSDRLRGLEVGADDFLTKPVNDIALFARVRSLVRLKRTLDEWLLREEINERLAPLPAELSGVGLTEPQPARFLVLEDNTLAGSKLSQVLTPHASRLVVVKTKLDAQQALAGGNFDLMILSMALSSEDPLRFLSQLRAAEATRQLPILLIVDEGDYTRLAKGLDLGANDYIFRPVDRNELVARARIQIKRKRLQEQLLDNYKRGLSLALTDELTGLYNRRYLTAHLDTVMGRTALPDREVSILMFDIDHFKSVNDTYGHPVGDLVLIDVAQRALKGVRGFDLATRFGGEEFVIVLPETGENSALIIAERLRRAVADQSVLIPGQDHHISVTISIGVATAGPDVDNPAKLLKAADDALYAAKRTGRNRVMCWRPDGSTSVTPIDVPV